ncbi:MAG: type II toxin-antitoxin system RelE/ParE family toxin [Verrucomicrobiales bacterium]|nr:type II toxin-antitoxin system RelE/ParE family toxin [Verrucomicrobiales bacterium]
MDFKIVWTPLARADLREIVSYIARDNPEAARRVGQRILAAVEVLCSMPELGRVVPERRGPHIREVIRGNYRIVYRVRKERRVVEVWRIWHGARGTPRLVDPA